MEWLDPTPEMLDTAAFEAVWQCIKSWDIGVPSAYGGYMGATGNHVRAILDALRAAVPAPLAETALPSYVSIVRREKGGVQIEGHTREQDWELEVDEQGNVVSYSNVDDHPNGCTIDHGTGSDSRVPAPPAGETLTANGGSVSVDGQLAKGDDVICPQCGHCFETKPILDVDHARRSAAGEPAPLSALDNVIAEMTEALSLGAFFNPEQFDTKDAILRWRDSLAALRTAADKE